MERSSGWRPVVSYYVTGGRYADTSFRTLVEPAPTLGPFETHEAALEAWRERARATIDFASVRYRIEWRDGTGEPPGPVTRAGGAVA